MSDFTMTGGFHTTVSASNLEESRRESLAIVLEYAYMGIGFGGCGRECHLAQNREEGCALCDSLTEVERLARVQAPTENWWTGGLIRSAIRRLYCWRRHR